MAKLYFSYAAMNAGKSTILLQASYNYRERGMHTLLFTSALYADETTDSFDNVRLKFRAGAETSGIVLDEVFRAFSRSYYSATEQTIPRLGGDRSREPIDALKQFPVSLPDGTEVALESLVEIEPASPEFRTAWISSRLGVGESALQFSSDDNLFDIISVYHQGIATDAVFVDEAQFLSPDQVWQLARVADRLNIPVLCYGLRTDFRGDLFPGSATLLAIADNIREVRTICHCGAKATMVLRQDAEGGAVTTGEQIDIEKSVYVSLCRKHWEEETGRWSGAL